MARASAALHPSARSRPRCRCRCPRRPLRERIRAGPRKPVGPRRGGEYQQRAACPSGGQTDGRGAGGRLSPLRATTPAPSMQAASKLARAVWGERARRLHARAVAGGKHRYHRVEERQRSRRSAAAGWPSRRPRRTPRRAARAGPPRSASSSGCSPELPVRNGKSSNAPRATTGRTSSATGPCRAPQRAIVRPRVDPARQHEGEECELPVGRADDVLAEHVAGLLEHAAQRNRRRAMAPLGGARGEGQPEVHLPGREHASGTATGGRPAAPGTALPRRDRHRQQVQLARQQAGRGRDHGRRGAVVQPPDDAHDEQCRRERVGHVVEDADQHADDIGNASAAHVGRRAGAGRARAATSRRAPPPGSRAAASTGGRPGCPTR